MFWTEILVGSLISIVILAYLEAGRWPWLVASAAVVGLVHYFGKLSSSAQGLLWGIYGLLLVLLCVGQIRRRVLIWPILEFLKKRLPKISPTEQAAISAGDVWLEGDLFQGRLSWQKLANLPKPQLTKEEKSFLNSQVEHLCGLFTEWEVVNRELDLPGVVWKYLKRERFFGMIIPKEYGGLGFSAYAHSAVVQKLATHSITAAITAMVPNSLGPAELLMRYGTEEQKQYYLPRLANGEEIPCFALTSPQAGSDAGSIVDEGIICWGKYHGKSVIGISLTWEKRYITLAPVATVLGLAFKLVDPEGLLGSQSDLGISLCLIPTDHPGVEVGNRHMPLRQAFMNGPTRGKNVFIPFDWIIGGQAMVGHGWRMLVECLSVGRGISLPSLSSAAAKVCYRGTGAYALVRQQFKLSIGQFEGVQASLAQIAGLTYLLEATRHLTLTGLDLGVQPSVVTAIAKYHMTEIGRQIINHAMDVHGGKGIMMGPRNYLAQHYQAIPISITVEGANILTRNLMIFGQGAIRCHPFIQAEIKAMNANDSDVARFLFDKVFWKHIRYFVSNGIRHKVHSLTAGRLCRAYPGKGERKYSRQLKRMSVVLSFVSDLTLILLGGSLKRRERLSARLGDVISYLYLGIAVEKYAEDYSHTPEDRLHAEWCLQWCLHHIQESLMRFFNNFPNRLVGWLLKWTTFPYGRAYPLPKDKLEAKLSTLMMSRTTIDERYKEQCFIGDTEKDPISYLEWVKSEMFRLEAVAYRLDQGLKQGLIDKTLSYEMKLKAAVELKVISSEDRESLLNLERARLEAIQVDEFHPGEITG